ncbi:MCM2/3/5 family-domain-containing protein [Dipodascopsis tothii]|uniref:MCM2/3/5 family-domain-containing protein n=1 Tax=Dipodascopsis tothii TaxID=44089 RepID=UPI0034D006AE
MSSPGAPSSPSEQATPRASNRNAAAAGGSSPLFFPSTSSPAPATRTPRGFSDASSPMQYSSSSTPAHYSSNRTPSSSRQQYETPSSARRMYRRGDIHSTAPATPLASRRAPPSDAATFSADPASESSNLRSGAELHPDAAADQLLYRVVWGTNVSLADSAQAFRGFLLGFRRKYRMVLDGQRISSGDGEELVYRDMLRQMISLGLTNLNLDVQNLRAYPPTKSLYYELVRYPQELVPVMDQTIRDCVVDLLVDLNTPENEIAEHERRSYKVRPFGLHEKKGMRDLNPGDIDKLVSVKGLVLRTTPIIPDMKEAFFRCSVCQHVVSVEVDRGNVQEPTRCPREVCKSLHSMQLVHNRCLFANRQVIKLQETPDSVPDGQTPHSVSLCAYDELVDVAKAGDRIEVTGVFRSVPVRVNPRMRTIKSLFKTYVDVVHIQKTDRKRMGIDVSTLGVENEFADNVAEDSEEIRRLSETDITRIRELAARPDVYEILARSLAPSIYEMDDTKKGILLQLFGGTNKTFEKSGSPRYRGDINVLLCGDPSTSKSQLLQYVHKIAPRGVYTSGKGSSAVGLTAYVTRDPDTKQLVLESGALVLSDGGVCCIDEFDKMNDSTRSVLHEVMEQQTISIAKAGIITTLNARTSILASANPIGSKYDPSLPVPQNIDLPPTLLSRFDLVYLILDKIDEQTDRRLARHLAGMYLEDAPENAATAEVLPIEFLTAYISYAKQNVQPVLTEEAHEQLVKSYVEMRKLGEDVRAAEKRITATTRQLESMIRLSEAHAKMRLSPEVTVVDVDEAVRLIRSAIKDYATDPLTGRIDMDLIQTGTSAAQRRLRGDLKRELLAVVEEMTASGAQARYADIVRRFAEQTTDKVEPADVSEALRALETEGLVALLGEGPRRTVRRVGRV